MKEYVHIKHGFLPVFDKNSQILILGTLPSVKSRENNFYYGHPQNRFWRVISNLYGEELPITTADKTDLLLKHQIALWDVILECDIIGSSDSSIKNVVPTDINRVLKNSRIKRIYANGGTAKRLFDKFQKQNCGRDAIQLPSTSPANAACNLESLIESWKIILDK